jgi:hypothetical protein
MPLETTSRVVLPQLSVYRSLLADPIPADGDDSTVTGNRPPPADATKPVYHQLMQTAPDGSPVELYVRLRPAGEPELITSVLPSGASVLELGCGTGRIADALVALGHLTTG